LVRRENVLTVEQAIKIIDQPSLFEMEHDKTGIPLGQLISVRVGKDTDPMAELLLGDERYWEPLANISVSITDVIEKDTNRAEG
jgi:hypothetical protein